MNMDLDLDRTFNCDDYADPDSQNDWDPYVQLEIRNALYIFLAAFGVCILYMSDILNTYDTF